MLFEQVWLETAVSLMYTSKRTVNEINNSTKSLRKSCVLGRHNAT